MKFWRQAASGGATLCKWKMHLFAAREQLLQSLNLPKLRWSLCLYLYFIVNTYQMGVIMQDFASKADYVYWDMLRLLLCILSGIPLDRFH